MIRVLTGSNRLSAVKALKNAVAIFRKQAPNGRVFRLEPDLSSAVTLEELAHAQDLFNQRILTVAVDFLAQPESAAVILDKLNDFVVSNNQFIFLETGLPAEIKKKLVQSGVRLEEFRAEAGEGRPATFNVFRLTDALAERHRQKLWLLFNEALWRGLAPEDIFWKLVWQIKTLLLVKYSPSPPAAVKSFVLFKAKKCLKNFTGRDLEELSSALVAIYFNARLGRTDLNLALERFILSV